MTDFKSIHARSSANEVILRSLLDSMVGAEAGALVQLISAYDRTVESVMALTLFLNEQDDDDVDDGSYFSASSSLHDTLDGEGAEKRWEQLLVNNPWLRDDPPDGVV